MCAALITSLFSPLYNVFTLTVFMPYCSPMQSITESPVLSFHPLCVYSLHIFPLQLCVIPLLLCAHVRQCGAPVWALAMCV